jgi:hypothetical protein
MEGNAKYMIGSYFRFLIKKVDPQSAAASVPIDVPGPVSRSQQDKRELKYDWQYLCFFSLWYRKLSSTTHAEKQLHVESETRLLLCFDLKKEARTDALIEFVKSRFSTPGAGSLAIGPFSFFETIAETVTELYDTALWTFRLPVRNIEKV